jgi:hypothetical protein
LPRDVTPWKPVRLFSGGEEEDKSGEEENSREKLRRFDRVVPLRLQLKIPK